jgi:RNA polymerase sigma factor (sigma-70 family)
MNPVAPHETAAMPARPEQLVQHIRRLATPSESPADTDAVLLDQFIAHQNEDSFAALVRRHGPMVLGVCRRILGNVHDAEDAYQAAFLVLARKAASVKPHHALAAWLYGVARRVALKARTANSRRMRAKRPLALPPADPHASPLDDLSARELLSIFEEELQRLPPAYRLPMILCCLEGRSQEEAAQQLGWTAGSVKGRLERGRARLHGRLTRRGLTLAAALMAAEAARGSASQVRLGSPDLLSRIALRFVRGQAEGTAAALAEGTLRGMAWSKAAILAGMMTAAMAFAGASVLGVQVLAGKPPQTAEPSAKPAAQSREEAARTDRHGNPLPPGAIARLGTLRFRGVRGSLAFSPDGKLLAAATGNLGEHVTLWDVTTGREVRQIAGTAFLRRLAFSSDGKRLACSTASAKCRVIDMANGKELFTVKGFHGHFSGDGKTLVTADAFSNPAKVHVWEAATGKLLREWPAGQSVEELSLAADGKTLALTDNADRTVVQIHDVTKGTKVRSIKVQWNGSSKFALSPDGKTLATAAPNGARRWNTSDGEMTGGWNHHVISPVVFSADGKRLAWIGSAEGENANHLWIAEGEGGKPKAVGEAVNSSGPLCFSPDGKWLAAVTDAHVISLRDVASGKEVLRSDAHNSPLIDLAFDADGSHIVTRDRDEIFAWQTRTGKLLHRGVLLPPGHEYLVPLLPGGYSLTGERTNDPLRGRFWLRDMRTGEEVMRFEGRPDVGPPQAVAAPGGRFVAVRGRAGEICVLDVPARRCVYRLDPKEAASGLKLSADGDLLVWYKRTPKGHEVRVHRRASGKTLVLRDMPKTDRWIWIFDRVPCVSPDGRWLVLSTEEGRLRRWELTTGEEVSPLTEALRTTWELVWSPDGRFVAAQGSGSPANVIDREARRDVRVWDARTGKRLAHLTLPNRLGGMHLQFTHGSRSLVTTDLQGVVHLWEIATGKERATLKGHLSGEVGALALSADDRMLVSGGYDSQGFVWDLTGHMPDGKWRSVRHPPDKLRAAWEMLGSDDAKAAYAAMWQLVADAEGSTTFLREKLRPVPRPKPGQVAKLIAALDAEDFTARQRATRELETLEESAAAELRQTLKGKPTLEVRRRIEALLARLERVPAGEQLQVLRAVEVLEHIGTAEARDVLRRLAEGAPGARVTREAQAARERLKIVEP